jgi:Ca2+-binding EF-hand superfamily protein
LNLQTAKNHFDTDRSGVITRAELSEGFKRMKVIVNEQDIKNLFFILDRNADNRIDMTEFDEIFAPLFNPPIQNPDII